MLKQMLNRLTNSLLPENFLDMLVRGLQEETDVTCVSICFVEDKNIMEFNRQFFPFQPFYFCKWIKNNLVKLDGVLGVNRTLYIRGIHINKTDIIKQIMEEQK